MHTLIQKYGLMPHPEGGYYKQVYRSSGNTASHVHGKSRPALTHIYFLLLKGQVSRFHRVLHDEVWNHYEGAPLQLIQFETDTLAQNGLSKKTIGNSENGYVHIVPAGHYQAAYSTGDYSLVGCTVAPGFDFEDFSFIEDPSTVKWLNDHNSGMSKFI